MNLEPWQESCMGVQPVGSLPFGLWCLNFRARTINVWLSYLHGRVGQSLQVSTWESSFQMSLLSGRASCRDWSRR